MPWYECQIQYTATSTLWLEADSEADAEALATGMTLTEIRQHSAPQHNPDTLFEPPVATSTTEQVEGVDYVT